MKSQFFSHLHLIPSRFISELFGLKLDLFGLDINMDMSLISLGLGWYKKHRGKNTTKKEKKERIQLNQVRLHLHNASRTYLYVYLFSKWMSISLEMRFAHLLKPCNVRFMFRFAQHGSHHMSFFICISELFLLSLVCDFLMFSQSAWILAFRGVFR